LSRRIKHLAQNARPELAANLFHFAAGGFLRAGEIEEAISSFKSGFEAAETCGLLRAQFVAATILAGVNNDIGNYAEAREWLRRSDQLVEDVPAFAGTPGHLAMCFERAIESRDLVELKRLLSMINRFAPAMGLAQQRLARTVELSVQWLSGQLVDLRTASRALTAHHIIRGEPGGLGDLEVTLAASLLEEANDSDAARCAVLTYFREYRYGGAPITAMLRHAIRRLEIETAELPALCQAYAFSSQAR